MKKLLSLLMLAGLGISGSSFAASYDVTVTGNIVPSCSFSAGNYTLNTSFVGGQKIRSHVAIGATCDSGAVYAITSDVSSKTGLLSTETLTYSLYPSSDYTGDMALVGITGNGTGVEQNHNIYVEITGQGTNGAIKKSGTPASQVFTLSFKL